MAIRYMLMPMEEISGGRGPKYLLWRNNPTGLDVPWGMFDFGLLPTGLVACDVTNAQFNTLTGNSDVTGVPANIDNQIGAGALSAVRANLESLRIPGNWIQSTNTYREVLRFVSGLFQFAQRLHGLHQRILIPDTLNLDNTWGDIPQGWQDDLRDTADSFNYDYSQVNASTPIRAILKSLGDQWGNTPFNLGITVL